MYLLDRADRDGKCYPAIGTIAKELELSRSTVKRAIADLEKSGRLSKEQRWNQKNVLLRQGGSLPLGEP